MQGVSVSQIIMDLVMRANMLGSWRRELSTNGDKAFQGHCGGTGRRASCAKNALPCSNDNISISHNSADTVVIISGHTQNIHIRGAWRSQVTILATFTGSRRRKLRKLLNKIVLLVRLSRPCASHIKLNREAALYSNSDQFRGRASGSLIWACIASAIVA